MPKRKDIKKILVVGAGPIIIGQACEFDYSGTQACKALKDEGYQVILLNSNPATIMTDPDVADKTYIEPVTLDVLEKILKKEKPDAILPTMGGQTALNLAMEAEKKGILKKYKIELIGANSKAISNAEDRKKFRKNMIDIGLDLPKSEIVNNNKQASKVLKKIGLPELEKRANFIQKNRDSKNRDEARERLKDYKFSVKTAESLGVLIRDQPSIEGDEYIFTDRQVNSILELRLYQLTAMERDKIKGDYDNVIEEIKDLLDILDKEAKTLTIKDNGLEIPMGYHAINLSLIHI